MEDIQEKIQRIHFSQESLGKELDKLEEFSNKFKIIVKSLQKTPFAKEFRERHSTVEFFTLTREGAITFDFPKKYAGVLRLYDFGVRYYLFCTPCSFLEKAKNTLHVVDISHEASLFNSELNKTFGENFTEGELAMSNRLVMLRYFPKDDYFKIMDYFDDHAYSRYCRQAEMEVLTRASALNDPGCPVLACFGDPSIKF
jgi:hypothetical protein